jgi:hypothetical protein
VYLFSFGLEPKGALHMRRLTLLWSHCEIVILFVGPGGFRANYRFRLVVFFWDRTS